MKSMKLSRAAAAVLLAAALAVPALAVGTSNWTQTSEADFKNGTFDNVVATNLGDLKLSRAVKTLLEQDPQGQRGLLRWPKAPDGTVYAGTGPHGVLLRVKGDKVDDRSRGSTACEHLLVLVDGKGELLIGTGGEKGQVLRIDKPGEGASAEEIFAAKDVQYVWAIRQTPDGNLYAATGPERAALRDQAGRLQIACCSTATRTTCCR